MIRQIPIPPTEAEFIRAAHQARDAETVGRILDVLVPDDIIEFKLLVLRRDGEDHLMLIGLESGTWDEDEPKEPWQA